MVETTIINLFNFHKYPAEPNPNFHKSTFGERHTNEQPYISNMRLFLKFLIINVNDRTG